MEAKYLKAIKAGLICAFAIIIIRTVTNIIFFWAASRSSVQQWVINQSANPTPIPTGMPDLPPDVLLAGVALCGGSLIIFGLYAFAGVLAAWYTAKMSSGAVDLLLSGAIAGAIAQVVSAPIQHLTVQFMNLFLGGAEVSITEIGSWLINALISIFGLMLVIAIILAAISALISGAMIKAFGRKNFME